MIRWRSRVESFPTVFVAGSSDIESQVDKLAVLLDRGPATIPIGQSTQFEQASAHRRLWCPVSEWWTSAVNLHRKRAAQARHYIDCAIRYSQTQIHRRTIERQVCLGEENAARSGPGRRRQYDENTMMKLSTFAYSHTQMTNDSDL